MESFDACWHFVFKVFYFRKKDLLSTQAHSINMRLKSSSVLCFGFIVLLCFHHAACLKMFESCKEIKTNTPQDSASALTDGFYFIKLRSGVGVQVFCTGMAQGSTVTPKEYLHFQSGRSSNYAEKYQYVGSTRSCTLEEAPEEDFEEYGRTEFEKVLFDPKTRTISVDDFTFATTVRGSPVKYGHAGDKHSYSPSCNPMGSFSIDLVGTPWVLNQGVSWKWQGSFVTGDNNTGKVSIEERRYIGCFIDKSSRDLVQGPMTDNSMTSNLCIKSCFKKGFKYAGTQNSYECLCGNSYGRYGEADESDCSKPCIGDPKEICGGSWRNSVYKAGNMQKMEGRCGGYPGSCYPTLHGSRTTIKFDLDKNHPCVVRQPCFNSGICIATNIDQFICRCHEGTTGTLCKDVDEPQTFISEGTTRKDDSHAYVACPAGSMAVSCTCANTYCDGVWFVGDECRVRNSNRKQISKANIKCREYDTTYLRMINVRSTNWHNPVAQCPENSIMTGCAVEDPWYQRSTYGRGSVDNSTSPPSCRKAYCSTTGNGCRVQARCLLADCGCKNGGSCVHASGQCACPDGFYGSKCENFDYCAFYEDSTNEPACLNGGQCVGVPRHNVPTTGGNGRNQNCQFPFVYQNISFAKCVETNEVGPPFACAAVFDGQDSYVDLGKWSPGPIYTMEVWVKALTLPDGRHAIAGGFDGCRSWGIGIEGSFFKAFYTPVNGCMSGMYYNQTVQLNQWYYLVESSNGSIGRFYVNGVMVDTAQVRNMSPGTSSGFYVGGEVCCGNYFSGEVKSLRVWKRVLSDAEIAESYQKEHIAYKMTTENAKTKGLVGYWDFGIFTRPLCQGVNHQGDDWTLMNGDVINGVHCNISRFVIPEFSTVSVGAWNGSRSSGMLEIFAQDIVIYGVLTAKGKGYRGGTKPVGMFDSGIQGESYNGPYPTSNSIRANLGGGGGGAGDQNGTTLYGRPGGGGGYGTAGGTCKPRRGKNVNRCGEAGKSYGDEKLSILHLGSGGGSGGNDNVLSSNPQGGRGGNGGGAIRLDALRHIEVVGTVEVNGEIGEGDVSTSCQACPSACNDRVRCRGYTNISCYDFSGAGGGGSGGSLYLRSQIVNVGRQRVSADGGRGGYGAYTGCGGGGGVGRIRIDYVELIGQLPSYARSFLMSETFSDISFNGQQQIDMNSTVYGNEVYLGCFEDKDDRHMIFQVPLTTEEQNQLTPDMCIRKCRQNNYRYAGVEQANQCFCDNQMGKHNKTVEGECSMACTGDPNQLCGDSYRLNIYGPAPIAGAAMQNNGVVQVCKPWCQTGENETDEIMWGECENNGIITNYTTKCECLPGYRANDCGQTCQQNTWGQGCSKTCRCIAANTKLCDPQNGVCLCLPGFTGDRCQYRCDDGMWGQDCALNCSCTDHVIQGGEVVQCNSITGVCNCQPGYTGYSCERTCTNGTYGLNCSYSCSCQKGACSLLNGSCTCYAGYKGAQCDQECSEGTWGSGCLLPCDCNNHPCDSKTGACNCQSATSGLHCETGCPPNYWGRTCSKVCNCGNHSLGCDASTGACHCDVGYTGEQCESECPVGRFGQDCTKTCPCTLKNIVRCDPTTGQCKCKPGYQGVQCHTACLGGTYGPGCSSTCSCSGTALCDPITGSCDKCPTGFIGATCQNSCSPGYYGDGCQTQCGCASTSTASCDPVTGICFCKSGYEGNQCQQLCDNQHWGRNCALQCMCIGSNTETCNPSTGVCTCKKGFSGDTCENKCAAGEQCLGNGCNCQNSGLCLSDGSCDCPEGFNGTKCESSCSSGMFGKNCSYTCSCQNEATCNAFNGECICAPGYQGSTCSIPCSPGFFGKGCEGICNCVYGNCSLVDGSCTCNAGYTGSTCSNMCPQGKYGRNCAYECTCGNSGGKCSPDTGICTCNAGYNGSSCSTPCSVNRFGENCAMTCPDCGINAAPGCDSVSGACKCNPGYRSALCDRTCSPGYYGQDCQFRCQTDCLNYGQCNSVTGQCNCSPGFTGVNCSQTCPDGWFGPNCVAKCQCISGQSDSCDSLTGECRCLPGFTGELCESSCRSGYFGTNCGTPCKCNLTSSTCDPTSGQCSCYPGYSATDCSLPCPDGYWGSACLEKCLCSVHASGCDATTGTCICMDGYTGDNCQQECADKKFGKNCSYTCNCKNGGSCGSSDGVCKCSPGYTGQWCEQPCDSQHFGYNCSQLCACESSSPCDPVTGSCICGPGYTGSNCELPCAPGKWGQNCMKTCPSHCQTICDVQDGGCFCGSFSFSCKNGGSCKSGVCQCLSGYGGDDCTSKVEAATQNGGLSSGEIAAVVIIPVLVVIIVGLVVFLVRYKRRVGSLGITIPSFNPRQLFKPLEEDDTIFFMKDKGVAMNNPNCGFDTDS